MTTLKNCIVAVLKQYSRRLRIDQIYRTLSRKHIKIVQNREKHYQGWKQQISPIRPVVINVVS